MATMGSGDRLYRALVEALGPDQVLVDPELMSGYLLDWTRRWQGTAAAVVRPGTVEEVQRVLQICHEFRHPVVPQGGNTGLVGGSIPHHGEVVMSLVRLNHLDEVDPAARQVTVGAGVTIGALQEHARRAGLSYGVDLASRDSATVGGTIATNAGGMGVIAHGDTRRQVLGLQVVFADGSIGTRLNGVEKQSVGPDLVHLLVGSEGTLGVITAARVRLAPMPEPDRTVALVAIASLADGLEIKGPGVTALEFFDWRCLDIVVKHRGLHRPMSGGAPFYVLVESPDLTDLPADVAAVVDRRLWAYREAITETLSALGVPLKLDVALPTARLDEFVARLEGLDLVGDRYLFGHLAEGNFHVNILGPDDPEEVTDRVLGLVVEMGGAIASEHGIGVAKSKWWRQSLEPGMLAASLRVKRALDPEGLLNPAVLWG